MIPRKALNCTRTTAGEFDLNGRFQESAAMAFGITASVQPSPGRDLLTLPEARRNKVTYTLYTDTALSAGGGQNPDHVTIDGQVYEVVKAEPWQNGILSHYRVLVQLLSEEPATVEAP
jgi:hypothetical protein